MSTDRLDTRENPGSSPPSCARHRVNKIAEFSGRPSAKSVSPFTAYERASGVDGQILSANYRTLAQNIAYFNRATRLGVAL